MVNNLYKLYDINGKGMDKLQPSLLTVDNNKWPYYVKYRNGVPICYMGPSDVLFPDDKVWSYRDNDWIDWTSLRED